MFGNIFKIIKITQLHFIPFRIQGNIDSVLWPKIDTFLAILTKDSMLVKFISLMISNQLTMHRIWMLAVTELTFIIFFGFVRLQNYRNNLWRDDNTVPKRPTIIYVLKRYNLLFGACSKSSYIIWGEIFVTHVAQLSLLIAQLQQN